MVERLRRVVIIPAAGHSDDGGNYNRGFHVPPIAEVDAVDLIVPPLVDELEVECIPFQILPVRKKPGIRESERLGHCEPGSLVVMLHVGWAKGGRDRDEPNESAVWWGGAPAAEDFAREADITMGVWGGLVDLVHKTARVRPLKTLTPPGGQFMAVLRLEPFLLNWRASEHYLRQLPALGTMLGKNLSRNLKRQHPGLGYHPQMALERESAPQKR